MVSEELLEKLEADAERRSISMSRLTEEILRAHYEGRSLRPGPDLEGNDDPGSTNGDMMKIFRMIKQMKEAGLL